MYSSTEFLRVRKAARPLAPLAPTADIFSKRKGSPSPLLDQVAQDRPVKRRNFLAVVIPLFFSVNRFPQYDLFLNPK